MLSRAFDHICMEKARYKFLIIIIIIINMLLGKLDYEQSLVFLGPSSKTPETPKLPRALLKARDGRGLTSSQCKSLVNVSFQSLHPSCKC